MKTREQIKNWLEKQPWFNKFLVESFKQNSAILYDSRLLCTIRWVDTEEGYAEWQKRNDFFLDWFTSDDKPMSWEEYCEQHSARTTGIWSVLLALLFPALKFSEETLKNECKPDMMSEGLCNAFIAYIKLIQLRNAWLKDWSGDKDKMQSKIMSINGKPASTLVSFMAEGLSFPNKEIAEEFIETFKDLLEIANPLL